MGEGGAKSGTTPSQGTYISRFGRPPGDLAFPPFFHGRPGRPTNFRFFPPSPPLFTAGMEQERGWGNGEMGKWEKMEHEHEWGWGNERNGKDGDV